MSNIRGTGHTTDTGELHFQYTGTLSSSSNTDVYLYYGNTGASDYATNATYGAENVWDSNYVLVQHFSETSGPHYDSTGTHDSDSVTVNQQGGDIGYLYQADDFAANHNVSFNDHNDFSISTTNQFTAEAWVKLDSLATRVEPLSKGSANNYEWGIRVETNGFLRSDIYTSDGSDYLTCNSGSTVISTATWYHLATTSNFTTPRTDAYRNGVSVCNGTTPSGSYTNNAAPFQIGERGDGTNDTDGIIDEVRLSNIARSDNWLLTQYNNQSSPSTFYAVAEPDNLPSRTINFTAASTQTINGTWTVTGTSDYYLTLASTTTSSWIIAPTNATVSYVNVSYSTNTGTSFCPLFSIDSGNNTNWNLPCAPTAFSFQRKTFFDDQNSRYWRFSYTNNEIVSEYSSDGSSWNTSNSLAYDTNDFDVGWISISGTEYVFLAISYNSDIIVRRGTLGTSSITWDGTISTALDGSGLSDYYSYPVITVDTNNIVWVGAKHYNGTNYSYKTTTTQQSNTITHQETVTGTATGNPSSVTSTSITGVTDHLYLASISTKQNTTVSSVTGLGLTWQLVKAQCGGRGQTRTELWYAIGTPSGNGTVTANFNTNPEEAVIAVSRYSNVNHLNPIGNSTSKNSVGIEDTTCTGGVDDTNYSVNLTTSHTNALVLGAVSLRLWSHTPGNGYEERADVISTPSSGSSAGVAVEDKLVASVSTLAVDGTISGASDYAVVAAETYPSISSYTLDNTISSWNWAAALTISQSQSNSKVYGNLSKLDSGDLYVVINSNTSIDGCLWDSSDFRWENTANDSCINGTNVDSIATSTASLSTSLSALADSSGNVHLTYIDNTGKAVYQQRTTAWQSAITLDTNSGNTYPTISQNTSNNDLYAFWIRSNTIYYKKGVSSYGSGDWDTSVTSWQATGSNIYITSNYATANNIFAEWYDGLTVQWDKINLGSNQAPNSPSALTQTTTSDVTLSTGDWHNSTSIKFSATATDPDNPDTLYLCVEADVLGVSFGNTEDSCGSGVAYSGTGVTVTHTLTLSDASEYHWQVRLKDSAGAYSSWVSYGANAENERDYGIDTTAPTGGVIYDGTSTGVDITYATSSLNSLSANWDSFNSDVSGLARYDYSIGTTAGATDVKNWTDNSTTTTITATGLTLQTSQSYYFNVRAVDQAGNIQSAVSSNGQFVSPSLSFSITPATITFNNLSPANSYTDSQLTTLTTSTNAYNGYVIRAFATDYLKSLGGNHTISDFDGGSYASPGTWTGSESGFGYTSSDTSVQGSDKFGSGTLFAPFSQVGPGDIVADHTNTVTGTGITNEQFDITYKVKVPSSQAATNYTSTIVYTATAQY